MEVEIITPPESVVNKIYKLQALCEQHPNNIPIKELSLFLDMTQNAVRGMIASNPLIGAVWKQDRKQNRWFYVPTAKFWTWYTNQPIYKQKG